MMRLNHALSLVVLLTGFIASTAAASNHLELSLGLTTQTGTDTSYEAVSEGDETMLQFATDIRYEVANLKGFKLLPFIGYRFGSDEGWIMYSLDTQIKTHDLLAGLRLRKGLLPFMAAFVEVRGGAVFADFAAFDSDLDFSGGLDRNYSDTNWTWTVGGAAGLEFYFSRSWMLKRGVKRFNFGGELGLGYMARGDIEIDPSVSSSDPYALPVENLGSFGKLDLSGWTFQLAFTVSFY